MLESHAPLNLWIYSSDLPRSRRFYAEVLGLELWREEPGRALHFELGGAVLSVRQGGARGRDANGVALLVPCGRELDELCAQLTRRGVAFAEPLADREIGRSAMFRDPDGYEIWLARPSATETQFLRWRWLDRSKSRRIPVNRTVAPRRHERTPRARRERHPET